MNNVKQCRTWVPALIIGALSHYRFALVIAIARKRPA